MTDALVKLVAAVLVVCGLIFLGSGAGEDAGVFGTLWHWAVGLFGIVAAVGLWRYQGWAFLVFSVALLAGWLTTFIRMILAVDRGEGAWGQVVLLFVIMALIAFFGRWKMEKRFRPHLDVDH